MPTSDCGRKVSLAGDFHRPGADQVRLASQFRGWSAARRRVSRVLVWAWPLCLLGGCHGPGDIQTAGFEGRTLRIIVPFGAGGGFDLHARLLARHVVRHLPGHPSVVVENMPGAGGLVAARFFMRQSAADGLMLGLFSSGLVFHESVALGDAALPDLGLERFAFVGSPSPDPSVCFFASGGRIRSIADWAGATPAPRMGLSGPASGVYATTLIVSDVLGLPIRPVVGYRGTAEIRQAMFQAEIDGTCMTFASFEPVFGRTDEYVIVLQVGRERHPDLPGVPLAQELVSNDGSREVLQALTLMREIGRVYALPPSTVPEVVALMRAAFLRTMRDGEFLRDAAQAGLAIDPMPGEEVTRRIRELHDLVEPTRGQLARILRPAAW